MRGSRGVVKSALCVLVSAILCESAAAAERAELSRIVDSPTAGLVGKGYYAVGLRLFAGGGVLGQVQAGALKRLTIGLSFGGREVIGQGAIDWNPRVEVAARYRMIEESATWPAVGALNLPGDKGGSALHPQPAATLVAASVCLPLVREQHHGERPAVRGTVRSRPTPDRGGTNRGNDCRESCCAEARFASRCDGACPRDAYTVVRP